jgi:hypothetical protein
MIFRFTITEEVEADTEEEAWDKIAELYDIIDSEVECECLGDRE